MVFRFEELPVDTLFMILLRLSYTQLLSKMMRVSKSVHGPTNQAIAEIVSLLCARKNAPARLPAPP